MKKKDEIGDRAADRQYYEAVAKRIKKHFEGKFAEELLVLRTLKVIAEDKVRETEALLERLKDQAREPPIRFKEKEAECRAQLREKIASVTNERSLTTCLMCLRYVLRAKARYFRSTEIRVQVCCDRATCLEQVRGGEALTRSNEGAFSDSSGEILVETREIPLHSCIESLDALLDLLDCAVAWRDEEAASEAQEGSVAA